MSDNPRHPGVRWRSRKKRLTELLSRNRKPDKRDEEQLGTADQISVHQLAGLATACWRMRKRLSKTTDTSDCFRRIGRDLEAMFDVFHAIGIEIKDYTGETFDYGLPLKVITTQPVSGLAKERVIETIKPTLLWRNHLIQMGEVIIETPMESQ
jgi:hypothetical protein